MLVLIRLLEGGRAEGPLTGGVILVFALLSEGLFVALSYLMNTRADLP